MAKVLVFHLSLEFIIEMRNFWYTFSVPEVLSQFTNTARTCVAFVAFLEYYGYAPCHGLSCKIHTLDIFRYQGLVFHILIETG